MGTTPRERYAALVQELLSARRNPIAEEGVRLGAEE